RPSARPVACRMVRFPGGDPGRVQRAYGRVVSGNSFPRLRLRPPLGRFLRADEAATPGGAPVVVVSHDYWQTRLGGGPAAIGRSIRVNDRPLTIIGVAPAGFQGTVLGLNFDMWAPATLAPLLLGASAERTHRSLRAYSVLPRLPP